jgi:hypothetical protein
MVPRQRGIALVPRPAEQLIAALLPTPPERPEPQPTWLPVPPVAALETVGPDTLRIGAARWRARHLSPGAHSRTGVLHTIDAS